MQHIRTSGLKKNRECAVIDEILNIRTHRKQLFSTLTKEIAYLTDSFNKSESTLAAEREKFEAQVKSMETTLRSEIDSKTMELRRVKAKYVEKMENLKNSYNSAVKSEVSIVKSEYEQKLRLLETKVRDVQSQSQLSHEAATKKAMDEHIERANEKYSSSLQRYKDALRSLVERERSLEDSSRRLKGQVETLTSEKSCLQERISSLTEQLSTSLSAVEDARRLRDEAVEKYTRLAQKYKTERAAIQQEVQSVRSVTDESMNRLQARHNKELEAVDEKVRRALAAKDDTILSLQQALTAARVRWQQAEELLESLNSKIQST